MKILVTGGAGFIGSHLCEALLARGDQVVCLDNLDDFYDPQIKRNNLQPLEQTEGFEFCPGDIRDADLLDELGYLHRFDAVVHLAARAGVRPSIAEPVLYTDVNLRGTSLLLEFAQQHGIDNFVFASSSSVYGERSEVPFHEADRVDHPVSPYAATKKAGELLCHSYHHLHRMNIACLRFFTVYGPRQRPEMAIHKFTRAVAGGRPITLYGDGTARRDFTYVGDIVLGIVASLDNNDGFEIYNLGNHRMVTLVDLIAAIGEAVGQTPIIDEQPLQPGDVSTTCADISHARERLGYQPSTPLEVGLEHFVDWLRHQETAAGV